MKVSKFALAAAGVSMLLWAATPALAGHGHGGGMSFGFGNAEKHGGGNPFGFGKAEKHGGGHHVGNSGNPHGNKHGQLRGLERANEVADSHGQQGRDNAAAHRSEGGSSDGGSHPEE